MAKLNLPDRGQPLDVTYIYKMAEAINDIALQVSPTNSKYLTVDAGANGKQNRRISESRILGGYKEIIGGGSVISGQEISFTYDFGVEFKFAPIVTATIVNVTDRPAGKNVSVILKSPSTSKVDGVVRFNTAGDLTVGVNLIVIGIPN
jgi:hypothetical protein